MVNKYNSELKPPLTGDSASNELRAQSLAYFAQNQTLKNYIQTKSIIRKNLTFNLTTPNQNLWWTQNSVVCR